MRSDGVAISCINIAAPRRISNTLSDEKDALAEKGDDTTTKWGIFVQESLRPSDRWIIDIGIRYDQVDFDIKTERYREFNYSTSRYANKRETIKKDKTFDKENNLAIEKFRQAMVKYLEAEKTDPDSLWLRNRIRDTNGNLVTCRRQARRK